MIRESKQVSALQDILPSLEAAATQHLSITGEDLDVILGHLAFPTGGTCFNDKLDIKLEKSTPDLLGSVGSSSIAKDDSISLNDQKPDRLAKLSGCVAVIKVGGHRKIEVRQKQDRFDNELNATRAAVEEGIVPGGGAALLKASKALDRLKLAN
ncbi:hypothetical protein H4Q26_002927 [Puccinia striiformis f. sp. tritici PST-130]|nr:hypothetical protein H4Q26_002927 [Puccinia striiformis f. sp. tritici PST-130]